MKKISIALAVILLLFITSANCFSFPKNNSSGKGQGGQPERQMPEAVRQQMEAARDVVVARVNGSPITMESVLKMMNRIASKKRQALSPDAVEEIKKEALDRMIFQELVYQKAVSEGMKADKKKVEDTIASFKISLGGEDGFNNYLKNEMTTEDKLRAAVERDTLVEAKFTEEVFGKVSVSEDALKEDYERDIDKYRQQEKMTVTDVVFLLDINEDASIKKADEILQIIKADKDKNPWKLTPDSSFVVRNIEIMDDKDREREREIYEAAKGLKKGEISNVIKLSDSIHIIKLVEYTPYKQFTFEEVKSFIMDKLRNEAAQKRLKEWEQEFKKDANIEIIQVD
jgi:peptidyl-prolyl cis-trans isomerase C